MGSKKISLERAVRLLLESYEVPENQPVFYEWWMKTLPDYIDEAEPEQKMKHLTAFAGLIGRAFYHRKIKLSDVEKYGDKDEVHFSTLHLTLKYPIQRWDEYYHLEHTSPGSLAKSDDYDLRSKLYQKFSDFYYDNKLKELARKQPKEPEDVLANLEALVDLALEAQHYDNFVQEALQKRLSKVREKHKRNTNPGVHIFFALTSRILEGGKEHSRHQKSRSQGLFGLFKGQTTTAYRLFKCSLGCNYQSIGGIAEMSRVKFFGKTHKSGLPGWKLKGRVEETKEEIQQQEQMLREDNEMGTLTPDQRRRISLDLKKNKEMLAQVESEDPRLHMTGRDRDFVYKNLKKIEPLCKGEFTESEMKQGTCSPADFLASEKKPRYRVGSDVPEEIVKLCKITVQDGKVSKSHLRAGWQLMKAALGENSNVSQLSRDRRYDTYKSTNEITRAFEKMLKGEK